MVGQLEALQALSQDEVLQGGKELLLEVVLRELVQKSGEQEVNGFDPQAELDGDSDSDLLSGELSFGLRAIAHLDHGGNPFFNESLHLWLQLHHPLVLFDWDPTISFQLSLVDIKSHLQLRQLLTLETLDVLEPVMKPAHVEDLLAEIQHLILVRDEGVGEVLPFESNSVLDVTLQDRDRSLHLCISRDISQHLLSWRLCHYLHPLQ